jgi:hypothetical protein
LNHLSKPFVVFLVTSHLLSFSAGFLESGNFCDIHNEQRLIRIHSHRLKMTDQNFCADFSHENWRKKRAEKVTHNLRLYFCLVNPQTIWASRAGWLFDYNGAFRKVFHNWRGCNVCACVVCGPWFEPGADVR